LSASFIGSLSHPAGDRPSHPICVVAVSDIYLARSYLINTFKPLLDCKLWETE
jgi:hypothetical protein